EIAARKIEQNAVGAGSEVQYVTREFIAALEKEMLDAAENLEFERAASLRDRITDLERKMAAGEGVEVGSADRPGFAASGRKERGAKKGRGAGKGRGSKGRVPRPRGE